MDDPLYSLVLNSILKRQLMPNYRRNEWEQSVRIQMARASAIPFTGCSVGQNYFVWYQISCSFKYGELHT